MMNTTTKSKHIKVDYNLPNHNQNLSDCDKHLNAIRVEFSNILNTNTINDDNHEDLFEKTIILLDWLGRMSTHVFDIRDDLEAKYLKAYIHTPKMAMHLFDEHYKNLHQPYSRLKKKCYILIDEIDAEYVRVHKKTPPNWS
jgi:hypothetical protein